MSGSGRVSRAPYELSAARNCTRDEGGPFEFGDQEPISSHRKLLRAKAVVVSVAERLKLTAAGRALLVAAVPIWKQTHAIVEKLLPRSNCEELHADLRVLS
jgi:hypothetical protein